MIKVLGLNSIASYLIEDMEKGKKHTLKTVLEEYWETSAGINTAV